MIQANELRIGNYLGYNGFTVLLDSLISPQPLKDLRYSDKWIVDLFDGGGSITDTIDHVQPIPLTEQWLIDFGAERIVGWDDMIIFRMTHNQMTIDVEELDKGFENDMGMIINSVHEYQNYVRFTIGKELTKK